MHTTRKELDYKYLIEGERLTMAQIKERLPNIRQATVRKRVYAGHRTWESLGGCPAAAVRDSRQAISMGLIRSPNRGLDQLEDEEDAQFGAEFEAALDEVAPDRHIHELLRNEPAIAACFQHDNYMDQYR